MLCNVLILKYLDFGEEHGGGFDDVLYNFLQYKQDQ